MLKGQHIKNSLLCHCQYHLTEGGRIGIEYSQYQAIHWISVQVLGEKGMLRCDNVHIDSLTHFSANGPLAGGVVPSFADRCALKSIFSYFYASDFITCDG